jgi:hypothetical protein
MAFGMDEQALRGGPKRGSMIKADIIDLVQKRLTTA